MSDSYNKSTRKPLPILKLYQPMRTHTLSGISKNTHKIPWVAHFKACSIFASSKMTVGFLPPNSSVTTLRLLSADAFMTFLPTAVLPVNAIFSIVGWELIAVPTVVPVGNKNKSIYFGGKKSGTRWRTVSVDDVHDPWRETCLADHVT